MGSGYRPPHDHPDARLKQRAAAKALLQSPELLQAKGQAALKAMRRGAANPTYSLEERAKYQCLADQLALMLVQAATAGARREQAGRVEHDGGREATAPPGRLQSSIMEET